MLKYFTKILFIFIIPVCTFSQESNVENDSIKYEQKYGLRVGFDLFKLYSDGLEINADYRS